MTGSCLTASLESSLPALPGETFLSALALGQRSIDWRNQGMFDQVLKRLQVRLNEQGLIDVQTLMIDSTAIRATRAASGAGKQGGWRPCARS